MRAVYLWTKPLRACCPQGTQPATTVTSTSSDITYKLRCAVQTNGATSVGVPWTAVRLIDSLDKKELGAAITASQWSQTLAERYIEQYKFKTWKMRKSSKIPVTPDYKESRAREIAAALVSHERWKSHGHAISREVLWNEIKLEIDHPDQDLQRAMVRLWALLTWMFDRAQLQKVICSSGYRFFRANTQQIMRAPS